jgi:uncharacterized C2H2 Zn-finger protein
MGAEGARAFHKANEEKIMSHTSLKMKIKNAKNTFIALRCFLFIMSRGVLVKTRHFQLTCTDCDNKYCHKQSLVAHKNAAHGLREFKCIDCSSVFGYESDLKRHFRSKHDGKQFVCSVCGNTFTYRTDLTISVSYYKTHIFQISSF